MNLDQIIRQYDFNLLYTRALVADLTEKEMTLVPSSGLDNHPAWTIGHMVSGSALLFEDLGGKFDLSKEWSELFLRTGPGDPRKPHPDNDRYPTKAAILEALNAYHERVKSQLKDIETAELEKPFSWRYSEYMPTLFDLITFMCINHEAMHLGQLAAWRRAMNLPSALALL